MNKALLDSHWRGCTQRIAFDTLHGTRPKFDMPLLLEQACDMFSRIQRGLMTTLPSALTRVLIAAFVLAMAPGAVSAQAMTVDQGNALQSAAAKGDAHALSELMKAANNGDKNAQNNMGDLFADGQGVVQDYAQAAAWLRKAADQGVADAQNDLGYLYENGLGVPVDYAQAATWYRKAADQGFANAQSNLGHLYDNGLGVPQDYAQAAVWYRKAADQGVASAQKNLGILYDSGLGVPHDYAQAAAWYRKAADQGDAGAQNRLGVLYDNGFGVGRDYVIAYALFNLASINYSRAASNRDDMSVHMTADQIAQGQRLSQRMKDMGVLKALDSMAAR